MRPTLPTPHRLALPVALACLLAACARPPGATPGDPAGAVTVRGRLAVQAFGGRRLLSNPALYPWDVTDLDHVVLTLAAAADPGTPLWAVTVAQADLATNAITFTNLAPDADYLVVAQAYRLPQVDHAEQAGSEIDAGGGGCTTAFSTSNLKFQDVEAFKVQLADRAFSGKGTGAGLAITPGGFTHSGGVGATLVQPESGAGPALQGRVAALASGLTLVNAIAGSPDGTLYVYGNASSSNVFRKISPAGVVSNLPITGASVPAVQAMAANGSGDLYVNTGAAIVKVASNGSAATFVGSGLTSPRGLAVDGDGRVYTSTLDGGAYTLLRYDSGASATSLATGFASVNGLALDPDGDVFLLDSDGASPVAYEVEHVNHAKTIFSGEVASQDTGLVRDSHGNFYTAGGGTLIRRLDPNGHATVFAGSVSGGNAQGTGTLARFTGLAGLAYTATPETMYAFDSNGLRQVK